MRKPARCAGTGGLSKNVALQADIYGYALPTAPKQDLHIARRFGLPPSIAAVIADLAWPTVDNWRGRQ